MPDFKLRRFHFNWRLIFVQMIANAIALGLTVLVLPGVRMPGENIIPKLLVSGLIFGLLNAFVRPILQLVMFRFLFLTFGLILVLINIIILWMMSELLPNRFEVTSWVSLILAGVLVGVFGKLIETLLGLQPPIIDEGPVSHKREQLFSMASYSVYVPSHEEADVVHADVVHADMIPAEAIPAPADLVPVDPEPLEEPT